MLSGPIQGTFQDTTTLTIVSTSSTHLLRIGAQAEQNSLDKELKRFWEIESLGILKEEATIKEKFTQQITFKQRRYDVYLSWKESHPPQDTLPTAPCCPSDDKQTTRLWVVYDAASAHKDGATLDLVSDRASWIYSSG